ncbi:MAG: carbohydrate-binding family 6 protein [Opitutaceae bacterium]
MKPTILLACTGALLLAFPPAEAALHLTGETASPPVQFALGDLAKSCAAAGPAVADLSVAFALEPALGVEGYRIVVAGTASFVITGGDAPGLMYGGLRLAELIRQGRPIERIRAESGSPYLPVRGLKMNIPLDARTPSYDDTGDSALWNIATVWDFTFWQAHLDQMARDRYNALTLWNPHPFPSLVRLKDYPDVALNDVCTTTYRYDHRVHPRGVAPEVLANLVVLQKLTIDEKIVFWRKVMAYAKDRGIAVYFITWNVLLDGAYGKYGITDAPDNAITIDYVRACTRELFLTYPDLAGIGVTAGENMTQFPSNESKEQWLWQTYGLGVKDVVALQPERKVRFIHRDWQTGLEPVMKFFGEYPGPFDISFKYAGARMLTTPDAVIGDALVKDLEKHHLKTWWTLRNDDLFCLRWGDPDFARAMIRNFPREQTEGFHLGSDGYVWARNFALRDEQQRGEMEITRHWYNFMMWGRLGYDPSLDRHFFETALAAHYPEVDAALLYDTWAATSRIMPQINRFFYKKGDWMFIPEGCQWKNEGFLTVDDFILGEPMPGAKEISIPKFVRRTGPAAPGHIITPLDVAENIEAFAAAGLSGAARLRRTPLSPELASVATDIEAMAWLGRYYADKIRGATRLAEFRETRDPSRQADAVAALENAAASWRKYAALAGSQYRPQVLARGWNLDVQALIKDVEQEIETVRAMTAETPKPRPTPVERNSHNTIGYGIPGENKPEPR